MTRSEMKEKEILGISEVTRRDILDLLRAEKVRWNGRLSEVQFLERIFDLNSLSSHDHRFKTAEEDIIQHREINDDWENEWIYDDERFDLLHSKDEIFLRFLCEMVHPIVRNNSEEVNWLVNVFNDILDNDGYEIVEQTQISGKPVFMAQQFPKEDVGREVKDEARVDEAEEDENKKVVSGKEGKDETQKSDKTDHTTVNSKDVKNIPKKDIPVFPDITPSSIKEGRFRVFEKGDFATERDVQDLIMLLFNEPECEFYYFVEKGTQSDGMFSAALKQMDLRIKETKFFYYKHPKFNRDYIHIEIRDGNYRNDWEKEVVQKGPMFCRSQLELTQRKKRDLEIQQIKTGLDTKREL